MKPGEVLVDTDAGDILANAGRPTLRILVRHTGDRPVQIGSHFHFFEVNRALDFDRPQAYGMRLDIAAGTAIRFEPGEEKEVPLVSVGGKRQMYGHNGLVQGALDVPAVRAAAMQRLKEQGFAPAAPENGDPQP